MSQIFLPFANKPKLTHGLRSEKDTKKYKNNKGPPKKCPLHSQDMASHQSVILTRDKNKSLTANAATVNNMSNIKSRSEHTHASKEIFMISV